MATIKTTRAVHGIGGAKLRSASMVSAVGASLLWVGAAHAQAASDVAPPLPNVLIILDSSGSMERMPNGLLPLQDNGTPMIPGSTATLAKNRWVTAVEVMSGSINHYSLLAEDRSSADFRHEFGLGGTDPYDANYSLYHYRPMTSNCALGSNSLTQAATWPLDWNTWDATSFGARQFLGAGSLGPIGSCASTAFNDTDGLGVLQTFVHQARFALMTFDPATSAKTGWVTGTHYPVDGMNGLWSYFPGWDGTSASLPQYGWPSTCSDTAPLDSHIFEVGVRNPSAPPWEGPLVPFATDDTQLDSIVQRIRYAMLAMRPYGATPTGPALADAENYFWNDPKGPKSDPQAACRGDFIILVTDGFPNEDLRDTTPNCMNSTDPTAASVWNASDTAACSTGPGNGGCCPAHRAQDIAYTLAHPPAGKPPVKTFVVGFALSTDAGLPVDCSAPAVDPSSPGNLCSTMLQTDPRYACCTLNQIAYNGGTSKAYLATDTDTLRASLLGAMAAATQSTSTSRTIPVFTSTANTSSATSTQNEFRSSFTVNPFGAWSGKLERVRYVCQASGGGPLLPTQQTFDASLGDDLAAGVNAAGTSRNVFTWNGLEPSVVNTSSSTIRRNIASTENDGLSKVAGTSVEATNASTFVSSVTAPMMNITSTSCLETTDPLVCKAKYLNFDLGLPNGAYVNRVGNAFADIYHATPVGVGAPNDFLRDESYTDYRRLQAARTPMLLASTNDGILHGFQTTRSDTIDPELWAFIPPAVLPKLPAFYPGAHLPLLDAAPVVKDVAFGPIGSSTPWGRSRAEARGGVAQWKTIAVGGLTVGRGYYAIDVTNPARPEFLWQITTLHTTTQDYYLFGDSPAPPAIGTVYYAEPGQQAIETPVAILPGGSTSTSPNWPSQCNRWITWGIGERPKTQCFTGPGQSLTIVRLLDGKVLRSFRNAPNGLPPAHPSEPTSPVLGWQAAGVAAQIVGAYAGIDAPLAGAVAIYPGAVGTVTTRIFAGDMDGDLWKVDTTDITPSNWTLGLFYDAYTGVVFASSDAPPQPVSISPVVTVDRTHRVTAVYATGNQNNFASTTKNHVVSVSEQITVGSGSTVVTPSKNWSLDFINGITPTGPLSLFSGNLYFSTFSPNVTTDSACLNGQGTLWGVDYAQIEPGTTLPIARFQQSGGETIAATCPGSIANPDARLGMGQFFRCLTLDPGTIVFGAGVTQRPTCIDTAAAIATDPYTGAVSSHQTISDINQGSFQLVAQTGPKAIGVDTAGTTTKTITRTLVAPVSVTRIDSWAAIVE